MPEPAAEGLALRRAVATALGLVVLTAAALCVATSLPWIEKPFPAFLLLANRTIAPIGLLSWPISVSPDRYEGSEVIAVDGAPLDSPADFYERARSAPAKTTFTYRLRNRGVESEIRVASRTFEWSDFLLLVAYLVSGLGVTLIGIVTWSLNPGEAASRALLAIGVPAGMLAVTSWDSSGSEPLFRLGALAETMLPAAILHFTLAFPADRLRNRRGIVPMIYLLAGSAAAYYQTVLYEPQAFARLHATFWALVLGTGGLFLLKGIWECLTTDLPLVRQRMQVTFVGLLAAAIVPLAFLGTSGIDDGAIPLRAFTAPLFTLALGIATLRRQLIEPGSAVRRTLLALMLLGATSLGYLAFDALLSLGGAPDGEHLSSAPLVFVLVAVLAVEPLQRLLQRGIDFALRRQHFDPQAALDALGPRLASAATVESVFEEVRRTISQAFDLTSQCCFVRSADRCSYALVFPSGKASTRLASSHPLVRMAAWKRSAFSSHDPPEGAVPDWLRDGAREALDRLGARLLVPLIVRLDPFELIGFMVLGDKRSGGYFNREDLSFLSAVATTTALSVSNALAYQEIQGLNRDLERKVEERTEALGRTNEQLQASVQRLEEAYADLQQSRESLTRAERLAGLGRLTAGIAHEMNTPLGASLTSLKLIRELAQEYRATRTPPDDPASRGAEIFGELERLLANTESWIQKAAAFIRSLKLHMRGSDNPDRRLFPVLDALQDTRLLLAHRLRLSGCTLSFSSSDPDPRLRGDRGKFGQVLTNLIVNAIDAHRDSTRPDAEVRVAVCAGPDGMEIRVRDHGTGVPEAIREQIFDEFFSTKPLGEGTGLGLSICRQIVTNEFGGSIEIERTGIDGTTVLLRLPLPEPCDVAQPETAELRLAAAS